MNIPFATHDRPINDRDERTTTRALGFVTYIAPLLSGFSLGAGIGVLLWQLF